MNRCILCIAVFFLLAGCLSQPRKQTSSLDSPDIPEIPERGFYMGLLPVPWEGQSFEDAYSEVAQYCEVVPVWGRPTPFYELADELSGSWGENFVTTLVRGNGMIPLIHVSFIDVGLTLKTPPGMGNVTISDSAWRQVYKKAVLDIMRISRPQYLSLGNEVNRWYEKYGREGPNGFEHYVTLYEEIYDAVKEVSPETYVFCTFAREIVSENREADLEVLNFFNPDKIDILVFTSYPYAVQGVMIPSDVPDDYYSRALEYLPAKHMGFSEIGWSSLDWFGGEQGQADFLREVCGRLTIGQGIQLHLLMWPWLCDLSEDDSTGLIRKDGTEKRAYAVWKKLSTDGCRTIQVLALFQAY
ncbi:MAG: hypothetical protein HXS44_03565 [Theionarchaea archaeon]|nr:hypothetical protein [Theionarchaea archaeon]